MALKHGTTMPAGITATGVLIHEVRTREEEKAIESNDENGKFSAGKGISKKTDITVSGDMLTAASLPAVGSGAATSASPRIRSKEVRDVNEDASKFTLEAHFHADGTGDYA